MDSFRGALVFLVLIGSSALSIEVSSVTFEQCSIAGLSLGDSTYAARELLGKPAEYGPVCEDCIDTMDSWYVYDGLKLNFLQGELIAYSVSNGKYRLSTGLGVGSTEEEIEDAYGQPIYIDVKGQKILRFPATHKNRATQFKLDFWLRDGRIRRLEFHPKR